MTKRLAFPIAVAIAICGCQRAEDADDPETRVIQIRCEGSDTMRQLSISWGGAYAKERGDTCKITTSAGGTSVGVEALIRGTAHIANCSRELTEEEIDQCKLDTGQVPVGNIVAFDAIEVYIHPDNPVESISINQIAQIFSTGGSITNWSQVDPNLPDAAIEAVGRSSTSGTYEFLRQHALGGKSFRDTITILDSPNEIVQHVAKNVHAIGYSGMVGSSDAKTIPISRSAKTDAALPTVQEVRDGTYPLARPLFMYTLGEPAGELRDYLAWIRSVDGQRIVVRNGYFSSILK